MLQEATRLKLSVETNSFLALSDWPLQPPDCGQDLRPNGKPELGLAKPREGDQRGGCHMHVSFRVLGLHKVPQTVDLLVKLSPKLFSLQLVVARWPEIGENKFNAYLIFRVTVKQVG